MSQSAPAPLAGRMPASVFYGWIMVAVAALGIFVSGPGQSHTFSVFLAPISADLGVGQTEIAFAYGSATLAAAFLLPITGWQVDRRGPRVGLLGVAFLLGLACMLFGAVSGLLWLALGFAALRFFGQGSLMLACANLVSQWFTARRGLAMSLMVTGFGLSMAVHPKLGHVLIEAYGWRQAWVILGLATWALMLPAVWLLVVAKPEDMGLHPDNAPPPEDAGAAPLQGLTLKQALNHRSFYILAAVLSAFAMLVTTLHYHKVTILTANGVSADWATTAFTISAVTMVAAMTLVGRALDRFPTRLVFAAGLLVQSASLILSTLATGPVSVVIYALCFGVNNSFSMTFFGYIWARYFGRAHLGKIQGTGQTIGVVAASLGPLPVSLAIDFGGDLTTTLRLLAIAPALIAILCVLALRTPEGAPRPTVPD